MQLYTTPRCMRMTCMPYHSQCDHNASDFIHTYFSLCVSPYNLVFYFPTRRVTTYSSITLRDEPSCNLDELIVNSSSTCRENTVIRHGQWLFTLHCFQQTMGTIVGIIFVFSSHPIFFLLCGMSISRETKADFHSNKIHAKFNTAIPSSGRLQCTQLVITLSVNFLI